MQRRIIIIIYASLISELNLKTNLIKHYGQVIRHRLDDFRIVMIYGKNMKMHKLCTGSFKKKKKKKNFFHFIPSNDLFVSMSFCNHCCHFTSLYWVQNH